MTVLASVPIGKAKILVQDTTGVRWPDSEWLGWLSNGEAEIASMLPSAYTRIGSMVLTSGTLQTIPTDGIEFVDLLRAGGLAPRKVPRHILDSQLPTWHAATATAQPKHFVYDPQYPKNFFVYPPSTGGVSADLAYCATPPPITSLSSALNLADVFEIPLIDYLCARAYGKDHDDIANAERSVFHRKLFDNFIGLRVAASAASQKQVNTKG